MINVFLLDPKPDIGVEDGYWTRLFPHGCCFLMTDSLFLNHPLKAWRILKWFREKILVTKFPGTWKVAMRRAAVKWLIDMASEMVPQGATTSTHPLYAGIYMAAEEIHRLLFPPGEALVQYENDPGMPSDEAPIKAPFNMNFTNIQLGQEWSEKITSIDPFYFKPDPQQLRMNDECLVEWFGECSATWCYDFRAFQVVTGHLDGGAGFQAQVRDWVDAYGHIEVLPTNAFLKRHDVTELPAEFGLE